jgi:hypothetical protein
METTRGQEQTNNDPGHHLVYSDLSPFSLLFGFTAQQSGPLLSAICEGDRRRRHFEFWRGKPLDDYHSQFINTRLF